VLAFFLVAGFSVGIRSLFSPWYFALKWYTAREKQEGLFDRTSNVREVKSALAAELEQN